MCMWYCQACLKKPEIPASLDEGDPLLGAVQLFSSLKCQTQKKNQIGCRKMYFLLIKGKKFEKNIRGAWEIRHSKIAFFSMKR